MEVRSKPGIIPNSLIIKPEIQAPTIPKKFELLNIALEPPAFAVIVKVFVSKVPLVKIVLGILEA